LLPAAVIDHLRLLWTRLSPLETQLLAAVRGVLPDAATTAFDAQVAALNKVQRSPPSWSEIAFYRKRWGRVDWTGVALFPNTGEFRLAQVRFSAAGRRFTSTLTCIRGHIFDFATTPGPRAVAFLPWDGDAAVRLVGDPLASAPAAGETETLPVAWRELLKRRGTIGGKGWQLLDESTAYRVALDDGEYLVLAERDGDAFVLHRLEPPAEGLYYLPHHDDVPEPMTGDVEALIAGGSEGK
jgi:hypothetical protein